MYKGLEETKASLRGSQLLLAEGGGEQAAVGGRTLPRMENIRDTSSDDVPELSTKKYPYLSNSTYSLPRNHRQASISMVTKLFDLVSMAFHVV